MGLLNLLFPPVKDISEFPEYYHSPEVAEKYDEKRNRTLKQVTVRGLEKSFFVSNIPAGVTVLELGAGTGEISVSLAEHVHLTAIDISKAMLRIARSRLPEGAASFQVLDMFRLDQLKDTFDALVCSRVFLHLPPEKLKEMLALCARRVQPGAPLVFDLQRGSVWRAFMAPFNRGKIPNWNYSRTEIEAIVAESGEWELEALSCFDHWILIGFAAFVPATALGSRSSLFLQRLDRQFSHFAPTSSRWGVVCRRR